MLTCHESIQTAINRISLGTRLALLGCLVLTGCQPDQEVPAEPAAPSTYFPIGIGPSTLQLQLALTPDEHQKGLMFRESLPEDHGMLFLFKRPGPRGFWMKNTSLPLDIGYFDASGRLVEVHKLFPYDETGVASRSRQILIAVETNRGWYVQNEAAVGAQLDMAALKAAIRKRGFSPDSYALED